MLFLCLKGGKNGEYQRKTENFRESWRMLETASFKAIFLQIIMPNFVLVKRLNKQVITIKKKGKQNGKEYLFDTSFYARRDDTYKREAGIPGPTAADAAGGAGDGEPDQGVPMAGDAAPALERTLRRGQRPRRGEQRIPLHGAEQTGGGMPYVEPPDGMRRRPAGDG